MQTNIIEFLRGIVVPDLIDDIVLDLSNSHLVAALAYKNFDQDAPELLRSIIMSINWMKSAPKRDWAGIYMSIKRPAGNGRYEIPDALLLANSTSRMEVKRALQL